MRKGSAGNLTDVSYTTVVVTGVGAWMVVGKTPTHEQAETYLTQEEQGHA